MLRSIEIGHSDVRDALIVAAYEQIDGRLAASRGARGDEKGPDRQVVELRNLSGHRDHFRYSKPGPILRKVLK
jgi:hypothetical protein